MHVTCACTCACDTRKFGGTTRGPSRFLALAPRSDHARRPRQRRWLPDRGVGGQQPAGQAQQGRGAWPFGREAADAPRAATAASDGAAWRPLVDARDASVHGARGGVIHASLPRCACRGGRRGAVSRVVCEPRAGPHAPGRGGVFGSRWRLAGGRKPKRRVERGACVSAGGGIPRGGAVAAHAAAGRAGAPWPAARHDGQPHDGHASFGGASPPPRAPCAPAPAPTSPLGCTTP